MKPLVAQSPGSCSRFWAGADASLDLSGQSHSYRQTARFHILWWQLSNRQILEPLRQTGSNSVTSPIWLNQWAADDLNAAAGDRVTLEYYLWRDEGQLTTQTSEFQLAGILPIRGIAADRNLVPDYPGISDSDTLSDWDPPFPMDLGLIRPKDEAYWKEYRATPKAFIALADGQRLWRSRFGVLTSLRFMLAASPIPWLIGRRAQQSFVRSFRLSCRRLKWGLPFCL